MTFDADSRQGPKTTLQSMEVHSVWARQFRSGENNRFFSLAFDYIARAFGPPTGAPVVDAGCGSGTKSLQLARRGYRVEALDFSTAILESARTMAEELGYDSQIRFATADLTALTQQSNSVSRAVCWGVLMHIPDITKAVAELSRVMAPGGLLVISEGNQSSLQAVLLRWLKRLLGRERAEVQRTPAGTEFWELTDAGRLMTRQADIPWLIEEFKRNGLDLMERRAGQFTEIYVILPWKPLRRLVHAFNNLYFQFPRLGGPSYGNLLLLRKRT